MKLARTPKRLVAPGYSSGPLQKVICVFMQRFCRISAVQARAASVVGEVVAVIFQGKARNAP